MRCHVSKFLASFDKGCKLSPEKFVCNLAAHSLPLARYAIFKGGNVPLKRIDLKKVLLDQSFATISIEAKICNAGQHEHLSMAAECTSTTCKAAGLNCIWNAQRLPIQFSVLVCVIFSIFVKTGRRRSASLKASDTLRRHCRAESRVCTGIPTLQWVLHIRRRSAALSASVTEVELVTAWQR